MGNTKRPPNYVDIVGKVFGRLTVKEEVPIPSHLKPNPLHYRHYYRCLCQCGTESVVEKRVLLTGNTKSCGCLHKEACSKPGGGYKGMYAAEYQVWNNMKRRCRCPEDREYHNYGGRGISYDLEWESFGAFIRDMGPRPISIGPSGRSLISIDRIDNDKDYSKSNCQWADSKEQANNTRNTRRITYQGKTLTISEWADLTGISRSNISNRLKMGWDVEKVFTHPYRKSRTG